VDNQVPSIASLSSLDDRLRTCAHPESEIVKKVFYSTRENVNYIHEVFRQAFLLPLTEGETITKVASLYTEWIKTQKEKPECVPVFMEEPIEVSEGLENANYARNKVRAGKQSLYQMFITNSSNVFLVSPPSNADTLIEDQVTICKQILSSYRYLVNNTHAEPLSKSTWWQLLRVLLHITTIMLPSNDSNRHGNELIVQSNLASVIYQTVIVSWIKASLNVHVSRALWDQIVTVFQRRTNWKDLIVEWSVSFMLFVSSWCNNKLFFPH